MKEVMEDLFYKFKINVKDSTALSRRQVMVAASFKSEISAVFFCLNKPKHRLTNKICLHISYT